MSQQVGFSLQGDVFIGGTLVIAAADSLLKVLSDGGVDAYAVQALVELETRIPMTQDQEKKVTYHE